MPARSESGGGEPVVRLYTPQDRAELARMCAALWPGHTDGDLAAWMARGDAAVFVAEAGPGRLCGFAQAGERAYADCCDTSPVAYLEGWYVDANVRGQSVGRRLVRAVEEWARSRGYRELASDTHIENVGSQRAHARLGFEETERLVLFRKVL
ncbi:MAG: GNAT family N-acetyltransferase [Gemmatimonadales bacterium]|jgi:aminoglycoside 6'-N-acetyltransferase I